MKLMRKLVQKSGVRISIIVQHWILADEHGVGGATGVHTQAGGTWTVRASAVIIASGGCAFQ